jgi:hypothetical protein
MSIRFAPACHGDASALARTLTIRRGLRAANDNAGAFGGDKLLGEALRHFARHGLGAAELARRNAEQAFFADDRDRYHHWLDICRLLDRRMAAAVAFRGGEATRF